MNTGGYEGLINIVSPFGEDFGFSLKTFNDYAGVNLYPEEMTIIGHNAVQKRKIEFCLGRAAAHSALCIINVYNTPVRKGNHNEPLWPRGIVGAISHCDKIALAAVASKEKTAGIGIDIERMDPSIKEDIAKEVCTAKELDWVNKINDERLKRMLMIFSAKESTFKAFFPITNLFLNFSDAELSWNEAKGSFSGKLLTSVGEDYCRGYIFEVGCRIIDKYIFTFIKLPPAGSSNNQEYNALTYS